MTPKIPRLYGRRPQTAALMIAGLMSAAAIAMIAAAGCGDREPVPVVPEEPASTQQAFESVAIVRAFANLRFEQPTLMTPVPGSPDRMAVLEQPGRVMIFDNVFDVRRASVLLDLTSRVKSGGEEGLLGLAFDPGFERNRHFYVYYSAGDPRRSVIARYTISEDDPNRADPASEKLILEVRQPDDFSNHKAGMIAFGPDGKLYIALGDGGGSGDPNGNAQNLGTPLGKILRIDPAAGDPYAVPPDNPFVGTPGALGEIWALGFRNPYRFSFDSANGDLWAGDVGERNREEIDLVVKGGNYGWNLFEGSTEFENPEGKAPEDFRAPIIDYTRSEGRSVIGGYVYHGTLNPSLADAYIYGDYYTGSIWALIHRDGQAVLNQEITKAPGISSFAEDKDGELYVISHTKGEIYKLRQLI